MPRRPKARHASLTKGVNRKQFGLEIEQIAVYKDKTGQVTELSAVCAHLGCIVHWNSTEKTWDCPCHGSRFEAKGTVLNGPAISDMKPAG
jgi:Rieske Fe-S protein